MSIEEPAVNTENKDVDGAQAQSAFDTEKGLEAQGNSQGIAQGIAQGNGPQTPGNASGSLGGSSGGGSDQGGSVEAKVPQFSNLSDTAKSTTPASMSRFLDVSVQVSAELGSIKMPIGDVLQLNEGSVIELNRSLSEPVDLVAQGVRIARGEVVVIDDCFAIRIREIESNDSY